MCNISDSNRDSLEEKKRVAIVCCYNRKEILDSMLESGLANQIDVDIIKMYYFNSFSSAASAYNFAIQRDDIDYYVFVHQDIKFLQNDFLIKIVECIDSNPFALYGLCGTVKTSNSYETVSNTYHGLWNKRIGNIEINEVTKVQGLDEILLACHRSVFKKVQFDEKTFDGWHAYVADLCMQAQLIEMPIYVVPLLAQHKNSLEMPNYMFVYRILPKEYFFYLKRLRNKYNKLIDTIITPCAVIKTDGYKFGKKYLTLRIQSGIRGFLRRLSMK